MEAFDSNVPGSALSASVLEDFKSLGGLVCSALCPASADLRIFNPQERAAAMATFRSLINRPEIYPLASLHTKEFLITFGKSLLRAFTKEQTSPMAMQLIVDFFNAGTEIAPELSNALQAELMPLLRDAKPDSEEVRVFMEFLDALIARLNFDFTETVRAAGDMIPRQDAVFAASTFESFSSFPSERNNNSNQKKQKKKQKQKQKKKKKKKKLIAF